MQTMAAIDPLHYFAIAILLVVIVGRLLLHGESDSEAVDEGQRLDVQGPDDR
jgi:hypothetical protein